jgi:four helix bundle protein
MSRDHRKLRVFQAADSAVEGVYRASQGFPVYERFCLQAQLRRAAVSVACNIVEGCARQTTREYLHFLNIASASAEESRYLVGLAHRLGFMSSQDHDSLFTQYSAVVAGVQALIRSLSDHGATKGEVPSPGA